MSKKKLKIIDFIELIETWETLFRGALLKNLDMANFLKNLRSDLSPYSSLYIQKFLQGLEDSLSKIEKKRKNKEIKPQYDFQLMDLDQIREVLATNKLSKDQLLLLGEKRFGLPSGSYKKHRKEDFVKVIESVIENDDTLKIIGEQASQST